jgi:integrase
MRLKSSGLAESTLRDVSYKLKRLNESVDLNDPEAVNGFIAGLNVSNSYKDTFVKAYQYYVRINGLAWVKPRFKYERKMPRIPTSEDIDTIISSCSKKYATIFKLLKEIGCMPYELSNTSLKDIDLERGLINIQGFKGHASRTFKLKTETLAEFKKYVSKYGSCERLFPEAEWICRAWRFYRNKLNEPRLKLIHLYHLRHYFASTFYAKYRDPIALMNQLGHKKLQTIMIYTQLLNFPSEDYSSAVAKTVKEACQLIESGFDYVTELDGFKLFRKRK